MTNSQQAQETSKIGHRLLRPSAAGAALLTAAAILSAALPARAAIYVYTNNAIGTTTIPETTVANCIANGRQVTFTVPDSFNVTVGTGTVALGLVLTHTDRESIHAILRGPNLDTATVLTGVDNAADSPDNYDAVFSTYNLGSINDGDTDPTAAPNYNRIAYTGASTTFNNFSGDPANGTWSLFLCDVDVDGVTGNVVSARLTLNDALVAGEVCSEKATYNWCSAGCDGTVFPAGGATVTADVGLFLQASSALGGADNGGYDLFTPSFARQTEQLGGDTGFYLAGGMNITALGANAEAAGMLTTWDFRRSGVAIQVSGLTWTGLDVDFSTAANSFRDLMRVDGFTGAAAAGTPMPYVQTLQGCNAAAGDVVLGTCEIVHGSPGSSGANPTRRFLRGVASVAFGYTASEDVTPDIQYVGISDPSFCVYDFGDAPDTYGTNTNTTAARHVLGQRNLYLGALPPDGELSGRANATATGDNATAPLLLADEDGVATFPAYTPGSTTYTVSVNATNTSGSAAFLYGYIDWNRDGDFADANERSQVVNVANGSLTSGEAPQATNFNVTWTSVPANGGGTAATFARFRISTDNSAVQSPIGFAPDGEVEDYLIPDGTLPVTIAHVETVASGNSLTVRFTTATESGNAGFRIWGTSAQGEQVELATLKSQSPDSFAPLSYETTVRGAKISAISIEDVSLFGRNRVHGPYAVGAIVGEEPAAANVDWAVARSESGTVSDLDRVVAAESAAAGGMEKLAAPQAPTTSTTSGRLLVRNAGIHRVTYEQLRAAGIDLLGVKAGRIALVDNGVGVPRYVQADGATFGPGGFIEFFARPQLTLASPVDALVLRVDASKAVAVGGLLTGGAGTPAVTLATDRHRPDNLYSYASPNGDPWFDAQGLAWGAPATLSRTFDLPNLAAGPASLKVRLWGWGDFDGAAPDHHVIVKVNGTEVAQQSFDGLNAWEPVVDVTGLVSDVGNTLEILVPGDTGYDFDNIAFEGFDATYSRATVAQSERFSGSVTSPGVFSVGGFGSSQPVSVWKISGAVVSRGLQYPVGDAVSAPGGTGEVYAAARSAQYRPGISAGVPAAKRSSGAQYLVVTHPAFASSLDNLLALEQSKGFTTEVVTTDQIYAAYSDHAASAAALKSFLSASLARGNLRYVLLVGADTTDPYDHLGLGSISYVPTDYRNFVPYVTYSPTDESLVDRQGDGLGDVPIGRLPVRTPTELVAVVGKLYDWEQAIGTGQPSALLAAGQSDGAAALATLNESYAASLAGWNTVLAQVDDSNTATVRQSVLDAINAGAHLVSFVGHSSMGQWDFSPILKWQDVATLTNAGLPNLVTAWGCWNSYYVEPTIESLSARLLRQPEVGAAGSIGATTLTSESSHRQLGNLFFARVNAGAATVGEALHGAKQDLFLSGGAADAIYGMTLLGDPAMSLPQLP